ncbi:hypothetical protein KJ865_05975, partial [Myxococcota bacterium]|nr:hypothetical protein [Myxococcota bacterium]
PSRESAFHIWLRILADMIHNYRDAKDFCAGFPRDLSLSARRNPSNIRQFAPFFHYDEEVPGSLVLYFPLATPHDPRLDPVITDTGAVIPLESVLGNMEDC